MGTRIDIAERSLASIETVLEEARQQQSVVTGKASHVILVSLILPIFEDSSNCASYYMVSLSYVRYLLLPWSSLSP